MPRFRRNRNNQQQPGASFPVQDNNDNTIPFYNARLFSMYESLIQSYTHFTYHANYMYNVLGQSLNGTRNSINTNPYPWLIIPNPQQPMQTPMQQTQQTQQTQPTQPRQPRQPQQPHQPRHPTQRPIQTQQTHQTQQPTQPTQQPRQPRQPTQQPIQPQGATTRLENNIINALFGIMSQPSPRLTQTQLNDRVEHVAFRNIANPINTICSITHDVFEPEQRVSRIRHCGHIFNSDSLSRWLRMNNTCPTCRHNLLSGATNATNAVQEPRAPNSFRGIEIPIETEININTFYNELLRNSANIPGFELNSVNDDSVVFSFDLMNNGANRSGPNSGPAGSGSSPLDEVD